MSSNVDWKVFFSNHANTSPDVAFDWIFQEQINPSFIFNSWIFALQLFQNVYNLFASVQLRTDCLSIWVFGGVIR